MRDEFTRGLFDIFSHGSDQRAVSVTTPAGTVMDFSSSP